VRPDRLPLVFGDVDPGGALGRKDVEVVEPEVGEDLFELAFAEEGPQDLLLGDLGQHQPLTTAAGGRCGEDSLPIASRWRPGLGHHR
jgi:hypothetical protein